MLSLLVPALIAGVIFSGMHAFAGLRLLERAAPFTGLAIVQFAALGAAISILTGHDARGIVSEICALLLAVIAAASLAQFGNHRETAAAVAFSIGAAATVIVLNFAPQSVEQTKTIMVGNITAVSLHVLLRIAIVYVVAAIAMARSNFLLVAIAAAFSVSIAGVLLVFSYLIIPPVAAMLFSRSMRTRLAIAWTMGAVVSAIGVVLAFKLDLPAGAAIVCTFGLTLVLMSGVRAMTRRRSTA